MRIEVIVERGLLKVELPYKQGQKGWKRVALLNPALRKDFPSIQHLSLPGHFGMPRRESVIGTDCFYKPQPGNVFYEKGKDFWRPINSYSSLENLGPDTIEYQAFEALVREAKAIQERFDSESEACKKYSQPSSKPELCKAKIR